ncbi:uncharacterized protein LOC123536832 [Mercenaria mercenaria]|uniref:uncharacterized protein LOC123536832 n=1 Tax=Mercenaria mercenaria TaxID=6596 RepID=UPI00234EC859|nr:uncharacterized protein LOC123536832 [Mercenaria mercenaria]
MRFDTKCLWTLTVTLVFILTNSLCHSKSTYDVLGGNIYDDLNDQSNSDITNEKLNDDVNAKISAGDKRGWDSNFAVWGKRDYVDIPTNEREEDLSTAQLNADKRKWSKFVSWGKRDQPLDSNTGWINGDIDNKRDLEVLTEPLRIDESDRSKQSTDKRKWQALSTWGKRNVDNNVDEDSKRGWSGFTSWGKRAIETGLDGIDKRKWQKFSSWGKRNNEPQMDAANKRKWAKFVSWGKRSYEPILDELDKRKWAKFSSWGKRSEINNDLEAAKRKWAKFTSWGKRDDDYKIDMAEDTPDKRKWNRLAVWGKRDVEPDNVDKRNWAKFSSWGKRPRNPRAWLALNTWGKRRWTGLTTWGKRSGDGFKAESLARKLLRFFDHNGDGALDIDELKNYIRTLMSLPSKQITEETLPEVE